MAPESKKWIVKDDVGHIYGPFELNKIRDLLNKGVLTGDEEVAQYPAGDWQQMSAESELYNLILDALSIDKKKIEPVVVEEAPKPRPQTQAPSGPILKSKAIPKPAKSTMPPPLKKPEPTKVTKKVVIELTDREKLLKKFKVQANLVPVFLVLAALVLFYFGSTFKRSSKNISISLIAPQIKNTGGDLARTSALVKEGTSYFYKDTFSNYVKAEEAFVRAVEATPNDPQALLMLILTDLELWPMAKQDSSDQAVIQNLIQLISRADIQGTRREVASPAVELILGHDAKARSQIDSALVRQPAEGFLYALKGQTFYDSGEFVQATSYFEKAQTLISSWVKPVYALGLSYSKQGLGAQAQQYLIQALKINPSHAAARLELGVVESRYFNHDEKAKEFLTVALDGEERVSPFIEARGRVALASILMRAGDNSAARKQGLQAAQLSPSDPDVVELLSRLGEKSTGIAAATGDGRDREHLALGDQYMRTGNYLGAQAQYKSAFAANPLNARAAMKVAEALWKLHQSTEAIDYLQKSIAADPRFIESYVLLADYKSQRFDFEGATRALEMAMKRNSKNYEIYRGYGALEFRRGNLGAAETNVAGALRLYEIDLLSNQLMSQIQLNKKDFIKALQFGKKAIEIDSGDSEAQVNYAKVLAAYQGVKSGVEYLRQRIDLYPAQVELRVGLAEILIQDEQYSVAEQILKQVIAAEESYKEAHLLLGDTLNAEGNSAAALNSYLMAARIDPSDPTALFRAGEVYIKINRLGEATKQFLLVLRVNGLFPRTHYNLARTYFGQGLTEEALKELEQEKKLNPKLADPYEFSGDILLSSRKFMAAVREYQKASEFRPYGAGIFVKLAKAYRGQGSYDEAMAMLRLAAAKESGFSEIYKEYGYIYDAKGMAAEAAGNFEKYLTLDPNAADRDAINEKLKQLK